MPKFILQPRIVSDPFILLEAVAIENTWRWVRIGSNGKALLPVHMAATKARALLSAQKLFKASYIKDVPEGDTGLEDLQRVRSTGFNAG